MRSVEQIGADLAELTRDAERYLEAAHYHCASLDSVSNCDELWSTLPPHLQQTSRALQATAASVLGDFGAYVKHSSLASEADERDVSRAAKELRAALRLRRYSAWDAEAIHDEGVVLGVSPARQSEDEWMLPRDGIRTTHRIIEELLRLWELVSSSPDLRNIEAPLSAAGVTKYRENTVFVMMWIDPSRPELEDVYDAIKSTCRLYNLNAVRADEIEHEEVITAKILNEIKTSEFLIADLTGERPSVYYEVGYAHSRGRRVIMYRRSGTRIHFDLAAYNCPEYKNVTDLKGQLKRRLEAVTNKAGGDVHGNDR